MAGITRAIARAAAAAKKIIPRRLGLSKPEADDPIPSDDRLQKLAYHYHQAYQKKHNLDRSYHGQDLPYVSDDDALRQRIADHYESVKHDPKDPHVARAFHQYKKEIRDQYNFLTKHGFHFDEAKPGENTASPSAEQVVSHIRKNRHLSIFGGGQPPSDHPLAEPFPDRPGWSYNHAFRAVHDVFGHAVEGNDFSNRGETNASFAHAKMFSPLARKAMLGDTLGQNAAYSHGKNSHLPENDPKRFPAQKAYLFPEDLVPGALRSGGPRPVSPHPHRIGKMLFGKSAEAALVFKSQVRGYTRTRGGKTVMVRAYERCAPIFTSYGAEVAASRLPNRAQPQQVLGTLRGAGVREEEIQESGLHGMLASAKKPVERGAVVNRLERGQPKMNEVVYRFPSDTKRLTVGRQALANAWNEWRRTSGEPPMATSEEEFLRGVRDLGLRGLDMMGSAWPKPVITAARRYLMAQQAEMRGSAGQPQYATYTLPGGKDYHELLLTLPPEPSHEKELEAKRTRFQRRMARKYGANADLMFDTSQFGSERNINEWRSLRAVMTPDERAKENALAEAALTARRYNSTNDYTSAHWPDVNVLAHVRFKEHPSTDGKRVLLVEEVQSDWHQAGRQQGYRDPDSAARLEQMRKQWGAHREAYVRAQAEFKRLSETLAPQLRAIRGETDKRDRYTVTDAETGKVLYDGPDAREARILAHGNSLARYEEHLDDYGPEYAALQNKIGAKGKEYQEHVEAARRLAAEIQQAEDRAGSAVPDAPFKKTWHELVMKRMLRWAAEHGFDKLAWTTGKQQNDRYNLTAVGKTLELRAGEHGTPYELLVHPHTAGTGPRTFPLESLDKLDDYVGHAVANTMRDALAEREAAGLDFVQMPTNGLEVGGQGMRGFYDKILPEFMGKYTKRWGGKVGSTEIGTRLRGYRVLGGSSETGAPIPDEAVAQRYAEKVGGRIEPAYEQETVHSVDITPEMREHVIRHGQYLFKAERPALVFKAQVKGYTRTRGGKAEFVRPHTDRRLAREGAHQAAKMHVEGLVRDFLATPEGDYWREALHDPERAVGRCDTIARSLYDYLHKRGVPARMVSATGLLPGLAEGAASDWIEFVGDDPKQARHLGHVFVVTRHAAIDISASQFGKPFAGIRVLPLDRYLDDWQHARTMEPVGNYNPDRLYMPIRLKSVAGDGMHLVFKASDHWRDEPRHPAGVPEGGQWRGNGNGGFSADIEAEPASAAFELTHGEGSPYAAKYPNLYNLCFRTNYAVTRAVMDHVTQVALEESGAEAVEAIYGPGGYQTYPVVPSGILKVREDSHNVGVLADIIGYLAQQTAVYVHDPDRNGDHQGIQIVQNNGDDLSHPKALQAFWNRLNELAPEIAQGFSPARHQGRYGIRIINSDAPWTEEQVAKFTAVVNQLDEEFGYDLEAGRFRCFFENHENNWKEHPDGKAYLDSLASAGRPDLQRRLQRVYGPATERWIEDALRTHAPRTYRAWAKGRHVGEGEAESLGLTKGGFFVILKAASPEPVGSLVEVGRRFPRRAHQMHTASGKVVWVEEQWVSARGHREPQQALPAAPEQLALPRARFRTETPLDMPHPERAEPVEADEEERVARQKAELGALADERRASPYSPLDFAERITDVERGGTKETVERTAQWIERAALDQYGQSPYVGAKKYVTDPKTGKKKLQRVSNQEIAEYVSPKMVDDILWQLEQEHNGSNWYKKDLKYVREQLPKIYPEMKDNPSLQKLFWMLLPPTSYGANPKTNFSAAHNVYRYFMRTGVLSPYQPFSKMVAGKEAGGQKGWTSRAKPVAANITALNRLRERFKSESDPEGFEGAFHWLELKHPVEELMEIRGDKELNPATETYPRKGKSPVAYGAMIFGPKGGSFFLNLTNNMEPLTADMWFTRSWGRYMGRVTEVASDVGTKNARAGHATIPRPEWPKVVSERPVGDPAASQRPAMREAIKIVSREVSKAMGRKVTPAECQAALWYYEQNLWAVLGADTHGYSYMDGVEYARLRKVMDDDAEKRGESLDGLSSDDKLFKQYSKRNFPEALRRGRAARYSPSPTARREDAIARYFNAGAEGGAKGSAREPVAKFAFLTRKNPRGESVFQKRITFKRTALVFQL